MNQSAVENQQIYQLLFEQLELKTRAPWFVPAKGVVLPAGQISHHVYCLAQGEAHVELYPSSSDGARVIPMSFHPGMVLLVHTLYDGRPDPGSIVASTDLQLYPVTQDEFKAVMHAEVARLEIVTRFLAFRLTEARKRERRWIERGAQERVAMALDYMAAERSPEGEPSVVLKATHELIAERAGLSRAKVSKELKRLEQAGHLRLARSGVEILNRDALSNP